MNLGELVPSTLPAVRPMEASDAAAVAAWVRKGRREGAFHGDPQVTAHSLREYQQGVRRSGWQYHCAVVEDGGREIGYLDWCWRGREGRILGVYVESRARSRRVGRHLLRWATAWLRDAGALRVDVRVKAGNHASLRACRAAGFHRTTSSGRGSGAETVLRRILAPHRRLSPPRALYRRLGGTNLYLHHLALADVIAAELQRLSGAELVLGLGSLARGFADEYSDLDLAVLGRGPRLRRLWRGEQWLAGTSVDLYSVDLALAPPASWDRSRRQALEESVILFSNGRTDLPRLQKALRLRSDERVDSLRELLFKIGWLGFEPRAWFGRQKFGYRWALPHDLWVRRGDLPSAHRTVERVADMVLEMLFLINHQHPPDPKWRRYLVSDLDWLPPRFVERLAIVERGGIQRPDFDRRAEALFALVEAIADRLVGEGMIRGDIYPPLLGTCAEYDPTR